MNNVSVYIPIVNPILYSALIVWLEINVFGKITILPELFTIVWFGLYILYIGGLKCVKLMLKTNQNGKVMDFM